jgi:hypothetical protein
MRIDDLLNTSTGLSSGDIYTIKSKCSQFIQESKGLPVYRALPSSYSSFQKVKVRHHSRHDDVSEAFNGAFNNIVSRSIYTQSSYISESKGLDPFYVFPTNGYRFVYSKGVQNSTLNFREIMETLHGNVNDAVEITTDLIKYTYSKVNLVEGITSNSEIIFYGIPQFYAVRVSAIDNYNVFINR